MKKILAVAIILLAFVACDQTTCEKATDNYNNLNKGLSHSQTVYDAAKLSVDSICAIFAKNERAMDVGQACDYAKTAFKVAEIALNAAKMAVNIAKIEMEAACASK